MTNAPLFLSALKRDTVTRAPFWFMRQAGRYLPEYRELRAKAGGFLSLCYTPEWAAEVTLQPIRRFGMDAAILFSDILVIPQALGRDLRFETGEGPKLPPITKREEIESLDINRVETFLAPVFETVSRVRAGLSTEKTLIGFAGAPWTVACYMIEGGGSRDFQSVRQFALRDSDSFSLLLQKLTEATRRYLVAQIEAGAQVIQLFDSWAGVLPEAEFARYVIEPTKTLVSALKSTHPHVPVIGFPRGAGAMAGIYARETGVDALGVDYTQPLDQMKKLQDICVVQGNLDPLLLAENLEAALAQAKKIRRVLGETSFIFNLGHGMLPHTPVAHVEALCNYLKTPA